MNAINSPTANDSRLSTAGTSSVTLTPAADVARVLRNTYALLAMTLLFSAGVAALSVAWKLPSPGLLLTLARNQKVDLAKISVLALAEQYLAFIDGARKLRLELAADYLVMAAWLAYLKSRLLLPQAAGDEGESGEEMAAVLQFRLQRLEAMRDAAARLVNRNRLGREVFERYSAFMDRFYVAGWRRWLFIEPMSEAATMGAGGSDPMKRRP